MEELKVLIERLNHGDKKAFDELVPLVYQELRGRAALYLSGQADGHTLQATALVHEAFLKMMGNEPAWQSSRHFFNAAAEVMRQILVSHARGKKALKRAGSLKRVELRDVAVVGDEDPTDWEALDAALNELREVDSRRYQVVMLRYFAGLSDAEVAQSLDVSEKTVRRDWATARLFLRERMQATGE